MRKAIFYILALLLCFSCGTIKPVMPQIQHDTLIVYKNTNTLQHDSIYVYKDRNVYLKGDSVFVNTVEYKDRWRIREVHDTVYKDRVKIETETQYIEKELTPQQKRLIATGKGATILMILGLIAGIGYIIYKKKV